MLTSQKTSFTNSRDVDAQVRQAIDSGNSLYSVDVDKLKSLKPDVILTQDLCAVCSIDLAFVEKVASEIMPRPRIVSLNPHTLEEVIDSVVTVGNAVALCGEAEEEVASLNRRLEDCRHFSTSLSQTQPWVRYLVSFL